MDDMCYIILEDWKNYEISPSLNCGCLFADLFIPSISNGAHEFISANYEHQIFCLDLKEETKTLLCLLYSSIPQNFQVCPGTKSWAGSVESSWNRRYHHCSQVLNSKGDRTPRPKKIMIHVVEKKFCEFRGIGNTFGWERLEKKTFNLWILAEKKEQCIHRNQILIQFQPCINHLFLSRHYAKWRIKERKITSGRGVWERCSNFSLHSSTILEEHTN